MSWDLSSTHTHSLRHESLNGLGDIEKWLLGEDTIFLIRTTSHAVNSMEWKLAIRNPASALQCIRWLSSLSINEVLRLLVRRGIPFNTFLPSPALIAQGSSSKSTLRGRAPASLGITRPCGYRFDAADYVAYEAVRDNFLRRPYARAALQKGGIIWQLVVEFLDPGVVCVGPSDDVLDLSIKHRSPSGQDYCDDDLTEEELDILCGVYKVYTGGLVLKCYIHYPSH